jgi:hypothetical protein
MSEDKTGHDLTRMMLNNEQLLFAHGEKANRPLVAYAIHRNRGRRQHYRDGGKR